MFFDLGSPQLPSALSIPLLGILADALERDPAEHWSSDRKGDQLHLELRKLMLAMRSRPQNDAQIVAATFAKAVKSLLKGWSVSSGEGSLMDVHRVEAMAHAALLAIHAAAAAESVGNTGSAWPSFSAACLAAGAAMVPEPHAEDLLARLRSSWGQKAARIRHEKPENSSKKQEAKRLWQIWQSEGQKIIPAHFYRMLAHEKKLCSSERTAARWDKQWCSERARASVTGAGIPD